MKLQIWLPALATSLCLGCASGGVQSMSETHWREDMGRMNHQTLLEGLDKIFHKHALQVARDETSAREFYYESRWIVRPVLVLQDAVGATNARNRIVIRGHRLEGGMTGDIYRVTWDVENEVTTGTNPSWHPAPIPDDVVEQFRPVYSDLSMEVRTGLRRQ